MSGSWPTLLGRTLGLLLLAALLGWLGGQVLPAMLGAALGCLGWHLVYLYRLDRWLRSGGSLQPPGYPCRPASVWKGVYQHVFWLRQRSRKRKRKLSHLLKQFQAAAAALPDAVVLLKEDDTVVWCNELSQPLLGLRPSSDSGLRITDLVRHPALVGFLAQRRYEGSIEFPSPVNAEAMLSVRVAPYSKKKRLLLATDVSRLHRLEQMRRDFVANVSHELRTPLTVINGYLETLLDSEDVCTRQWQLPLRRMAQQSCRMLRIVEDLLVLSRLETQVERPPPQPVNVPAILAAIAEDAGALSGERNHRIAVQADPALWVRGCEQELRSAFSNLVFNAVQYTPPGGRIEIRWYADERGAHMEVEDNGEGIPAQHLSRITERFYRVDRNRSREGGGTGLGLAIVKHVLKNHGARLGITSLVGIGSIFACDFPPELYIRKALPAAVHESESS